MTIKRPTPNILDRLFNGLRKKRGLIIPDKAHEQYGPRVYAVARKESFWGALFRLKGRDLPEGMVDLMEFDEALGARNANSDQRMAPTYWFRVWGESVYKGCIR
jgi:hypothetical protein